MNWKIRGLAFGLVMGTAVCAAASEEGPARPSFRADGTVEVPAFELPPSDLMSEEARAFMRMRSQMDDARQVMEPDVAKSRAMLEKSMAPQVEAMLQAYPVKVKDRKIAGVETKVFTPKGAKADPKRVLMNVHGGAFQTCWPSCAMLESIPVSSLGGYKVVSVNYRMAPEHKHPAGAEDGAAVYRALLEDYDPESIGIYGCSAGGALTAQLAAWLPKHDLPQAGAIGIFGAGAVRFNAGDSAWVTAYIDGSFPPPPGPGQPRIDMTRGYFDGADRQGEIVSPALHPQVLEKFPPTLVITGTRAMDLSPAVYTNSQLLKAGRPSTLLVGEGMGHCYVYFAGLPEAREAHQITVDFFRKNLK